MLGVAQFGSVRFVHPQIRDVLEVANVACHQGQIVGERRGGDDKVHVADLPPKLAGETAANDSESLQDLLGDW
jgi:hypothetical protein